MELKGGIGIGGYRHYFFESGPNTIAFFEYKGATSMVKKDHGVETSEPRGFDHVSFAVETVDDLFAVKDKLEAAGISVNGVVDHGKVWSIYFHDPNNIPLEVSWTCMVLNASHIFFDEEPLTVATEGGMPQPGHWPAVSKPTPRSEFTARPGNGHALRQRFVDSNKGSLTDEFKRLLTETTGPTSG